MAKPQSVYEFKAKDIEGNEIDFKKYAGKPLLIVNVASKCGFTDKGYKSMVDLQTKHKDKLEILAFPCNQFGGQEPGSNDQICTFAGEKYKFKGQLMDKVDVNGEKAHPLFKWMKEQAPGLLGTTSIKWNFTKFLVNKEGKVVKRYSAMDSAESVEKDLVALF